MHDKPHSAATKRKIAKSMTGPKNPMYKDGRRSYRTKMNAKPGQVVNHKNEDRTDNRKSNLEVVSDSAHRAAHMAKTNKAGVTGPGTQGESKSSNNKYRKGVKVKKR